MSLVKILKPALGKRYYSGQLNLRPEPLPLPQHEDSQMARHLATLLLSCFNTQALGWTTATTHLLGLTLG